MGLIFFVFILITYSIMGILLICLAWRKMICNLRNPYPTFEEQDEKRISDIFAQIRKEGLKLKTRSILEEIE